MLKLSKISKYFPGVKALDNVSVEFNKGEIHALLGENGAGKSTVIKIICGVFQPDEGKMYLNDKELKVENFIDALVKDISVVNQELQVISSSSIAENIMLDKMVIFGKTGIINWRKVNIIAEKYLKMVGLDIPPTEPMSTLSVAQKQMVEIAKALSSNSKILLLDEPTSSISEKEAEKLFEIVKDLKAKGIIIIFVTHKLEEVLNHCDKVTVLRDGKLMGTKNIEEVDRKILVKMMIGREEEIEIFTNDNVNKNKKVLEVKNIIKKDKAKDISFYLYKGEILGFYGLVGAGRTELARLLIGKDKKESGDVFVNGKKIKVKSISDSLYRHKIGYVTENRKEEGLFLFSTIVKNICITIWPRIASKVLRFINGKEEVKNSKTIIDELDIRTTGLDQIVNTLSGGNQQKVSISKWLIADCDVIIFDEPTVGIDVGAKEYIHKLIYELALNEKKSIILISSDMPEIIKLASRIIVFNDKKIIGEIDNVSRSSNSYEEVSTKIGSFYL